MYIGQSVNIRNRLYEHKTALKRGIHANAHLQSAVNEYGLENFEFAVLALCAEEDIDDLERFYISKYKTQDRLCGYNIDEGGHYGRHRPPETIEKMRQANLGKKASEETRRKLSEKAKRNADKARESIKKNSCTWGKKDGDCPHSKAVIQYDLKGNIIKEWPCISTAARALKIDGSGISRVCLKTRTTCAGFKWAYKAEEVALFQR